MRPFPQRRIQMVDLGVHHPGVTAGRTIESSASFSWKNEKSDRRRRLSWGGPARTRRRPALNWTATSGRRRIAARWIMDGRPHSVVRTPFRPIQTTIIAHGDPSRNKIFLRWPSYRRFKHLFVSDDIYDILLGSRFIHLGPFCGPTLDNCFNSYSFQ